MLSRPRLAIEPLGAWPYPAEPQTRSPFSATYSTTRDLLLTEAAALRCDLVVVELDVTRAQIRNDGDLKARMRPTSDRVRVSLDTRHGPLRYAVGRYEGTTRIPGWQHNLRAIALTLQALRAVDRWGAVHDGEQYRGFLAIEAGPSATGPGLGNADAAARWLRAEGGWPDDMSLRDVVRAARAVWHPDRCDGDRTRWDRLEQAVTLLSAAGMV